MGDTDRFEFIYGDDYGEIDIETLGTRQGTTTRRMEVDERLARDLYEELHDHFQDATEKYVVYGSEGYSLANVCIVEATSEEEAIEKSEDYATFVGSRPSAKKVDEYPEHGDVWAAVM